MQENKEDILKGLEPLFKEAIEKNLWFYSHYHSMWFSPSELKAEHHNDKFVWRPVNWELRHPIEHIDDVKREILLSLDHIYNFQIRIFNQQRDNEKISHERKP